ncbi:MAG: hypothetical protein ABJ275_00210 [Maricaulaceae bacterium]
MSQDLGPYMVQTIGRRVAPLDAVPPSQRTGLPINDRTAYKRQSFNPADQIAEGRQAAFNHWLSRVSHMLDEWEMELIGHAAPLSTFETIAAFKDVLSRRTGDLT